MAYLKTSKPHNSQELSSTKHKTPTAFVDKRTSLTAQLHQQHLMRNSQQSLAQLATQSMMGNSAKPNNAGLPHQLKAGIEALSGFSMDHVRVHYNSDKPAQLNAHAYAQGSDIHIAAGQEKHLSHEAWHLVQQAQGRVKPTMQMKGGVPVNDDAGLEAEADVMGAKALEQNISVPAQRANSISHPASTAPAQRKVINTTQGWYSTRTKITYTTELEAYKADAAAAKIKSDELKKANKALLRELKIAGDQANAFSRYHTESTSLLNNRYIDSTKKNIENARQEQSSANFNALVEGSACLFGAYDAVVNTSSYYSGLIGPAVLGLAIEGKYLRDAVINTPGAASRKAMQGLGSLLTFAGNSLIGYAGTVAAANNDWAESTYGVNVVAPNITGNNPLYPAYSGLTTSTIISMVTGITLTVTGIVIKVKIANNIANEAKSALRNQIPNEESL